MPVFQSEPGVLDRVQFQSHLAVGHVLGERGEHDLGLRIEHFSNAGIREPNPGMNFGSLRYTYRFDAGGEGLGSQAGENGPAIPRMRQLEADYFPWMRGPPKAVNTPSPMNVPPDR